MPIASTQNLEYLKQLGADEVIVYKRQHFENLFQNTDLVLEANPNRDNNKRLKSLKVSKEAGVLSYLTGQVHSKVIV